MKFSIHPAADADMWIQWGWYGDQGVPQIAQNFLTAVERAYTAIKEFPLAGAPRYCRNSGLTGLRVWPIKGFKELRVYYLVRGDTIIVMRILHDKRDVRFILEKQTQ